MKALWLPDPAILRRGEVPSVPSAACKLSSAPFARQPPSVHRCGRRRTFARERRAAAMESRNERRTDDPTIVVAGGLPRAAVVGVLGGGQLGKMLAMEAVRFRRPPSPAGSGPCRPPCLSRTSPRSALR